MKTVLLQCGRCHQTANVGTFLSGYESCLLRAFCKTCQVSIQVFILYEHLKTRISVSTEEHVRLTAIDEKQPNPLDARKPPVAAHA